MGEKIGRVLARFACMIACCVAPAARGDTGPQALDPAGFEAFDERQIAVGHLLFYDPVLSGNRSVSCATCHHPRFGTSDGVSLGMGDGGRGLGPDRSADAKNLPEQRIPRNSPALFNLGHRDIAVMFHDGRIEVDPARPSGLRTPLDEDMVTGFASLLSAQTMFPVLSPDEMAGHYQENDVALAVRQGRLTGEGGAWSLIAARVDAIPAYRNQFAAFDARIAAGDPVSFVDISDAIAAFIATEWRADQTPFDMALRGDAPLTADAQRGMDLFFGDAGCGACHSGPLLSDQGFHAMAEPQIGPGKAARFETHAQDLGRMRVTGDEADAYAFRTPMLRNVAITGPWGHAGAFSDLGAYLRHHIDPVAGLEAYAPQAVFAALPSAEAVDYAMVEDTGERAAIIAAYRGAPVTLSDAQIDDILAFLNALTDTTSLEGGLGVPDAVPSGLPVER